MGAVLQITLDFARALLGGDWNVMGLLAGFVGGVTAFFFGMPSLKVLSTTMYVGMEPSPELRFYNRMSRGGLILIAAGFACQLLSAVHPIQVKPVTAALVDVWTAILAFVSAVLWGASARVSLKTTNGFDSDKELNEASLRSSWLNAGGAAFAALAALLQAAKPVLVA